MRIPTCPWANSDINLELKTKGLARDQVDQNTSDHGQRRLLGPFVAAHLRVYRNPLLTRSFFEQTAPDLRDDLDSESTTPKSITAKSSDASGWRECDVAEILRAWKLSVSHLEISQVRS